MAKLIATRGLPASGKSTWALAKIAKRPGQTIRVNRDDLRASVHGGGKWSKAKERIITVMRDAMIHEGLASGLTVISDDTNLSPKVVEHLRTLAKANGAEFEIEDFTDVTPEECIKRDLARDRTVGSDVIMRMFNDHLKPDTTVTVDERLPKCIIVDVDGTLALHVSRGPFEYEKCLEDAPNPRVVEIIKMLKGTYEIVVCSGREGTEQCHGDTVEWLHRHGITYSAFFIRPEGDTRKDSIIKREILERDILPRWNPVLVVDDRDQVVRMWRDAGLPCWQVADGAF
jgi:predicted kinase